MLVFAFYVLVGWILIILKENLVICLPLPKRCLVPVHISIFFLHHNFGFHHLPFHLPNSNHHVFLNSLPFYNNFTHPTLFSQQFTSKPSCQMRGKPIALWSNCALIGPGTVQMGKRRDPNLLFKDDPCSWLPPDKGERSNLMFFNPVKRRASESLECLIRPPDETKISPFSTNRSAGTCMCALWPLGADTVNQ